MDRRREDSMLSAAAEGKTLSLLPENGTAIWLVLDLAPKKRGSLEAELVTLGGRLASAGARATFVFSAPPPAWMAAALAASAVDVRTLDFNRAGLAALQLFRWLDAARPALVHFHFVRAYSPLVAVAKVLGARVMLHDHITLGQPASPDHPERAPMTKVLVQGYKLARAAALNGLVDRRVAVSRFVADSVRDSEFVAPNKIAVVENGIDVARFAAVDGAPLRTELRAGRRPIVGCVSRMAPEKGIDVLIRAMARVGRDALLVLAGDGPGVPACRALAAALGLGDHVRFLGLRDDVERIYAAADVMVTPSLWDEAFGLAVVEAMAAGRPVVVTDSGAMPEIVAHGRCGLVVPRHDEVAMAGAIGRVLDDRALAAHLGRAARQRALAAFAMPVWVDRMMREYAAMVPSLEGAARRVA
jgi:glycosyltransferase involved in cell wall biosynthesis